MNSNKKRCDFFNSGKKAQGGVQTSVLIGIVALMIIAYLLFLPPEVREEMLFGNDSEGSSSDADAKVVFLNEKPGKLEPSSIFDRYEDGHSFSDVYLKVSSEATILKKINPFYIRSSVFSSVEKSVIFELKSAERTEGVLLSFSAREHSGRLAIMLNGEEIFNGEITTLNPEPIELPSMSLAEKNILEFSVSKPGAAFWRSNSYSLEDIKITGYVTDTVLQSSKNVFELVDFERNNIENEMLSMYIECLSTEAGRISVSLNGNEIADFAPSCSDVKRIEVSPSKLAIGENSIVFSTDVGRYMLQQIRMVPEFKEIMHPVYYFSVNEKDFNRIKNGTVGARLSIRFADDSEKSFDFKINNVLKHVETSDVEYKHDISKDDIVLGNNAFKLEPLDTIDVAQIRIETFLP
ncbi:MAG: hypothetical protein NTV63_05225 [Candidatus Woesearchaeota archaeon]|nr:hypothetical protein [Candidatus Woesearchaeota archaeon]